MIAGRQGVNRELVQLAEVGRADPGASSPGSRAADDHGQPVDRGGQDQAAVVVGVIAQQLDPTGARPITVGSPPKARENVAWARSSSVEGMSGHRSFREIER